MTEPTPPVPPPRPDRVWQSGEQWLRGYVQRGSAAQLLHLEAGPFLGLALAALLATGYLVWASTSQCIQLLCGLLALYFVLDTLLVNTGIAFVTRSPRSFLRSVILTLFAFLDLVVAFSVFYVIFGTSFKPALNFSRAIYLSLVTITTLGAADIQPIDDLARTLSAVQVATGIYFLAVILAVVTNWAPRGNAD
jgi:hypothetical protein